MPRPITALLAWCALCTLASAIGVADLGVWVFELLLGAIAIAALATTWRRLTFSTLAYAMAGIHYAVLALGARYTYAEVPITEWAQEALDLSRNHFDRVGHFMQGFVPAFFAREILTRVHGLRGATRFLLVSSVCLAFSASYEILETLVVIVFYPDSGPEWLGWQGDTWDAQWDMTCALTGSVLAQLALGRLHDRSIARVARP